MDSFLGRYELLGLIAAGGMGKVYLARAIGEGGFEREVALKVMHPHLLHEPDFIAMFLDEARLAALIRHPHVVPTLDIQKTDSHLFLVMEFVEGLTASALLKQHRRRARAHAGQETTGDGGLPRAGGTEARAEPWVPLPVDVATRIIVDVLSGLHAAHDLTNRDGHPLHLVHRDVSPGNVLIGTDGVARITDFGVARAETRLTATMGGQIKGKLAYMPPEQLMADRVDRRADIYSAAVVLWELLVGRRLFCDDQQGALMRSVLQGATARPSEINREVPAALDAVCMRGLARDPAARFASAADFGEAIEEAIQGSGSAVASPRRLASFVASFETNVSAMTEARQSAPSVQRMDLSDSALTPPAQRAGRLPSEGGLPTVPTLTSPQQAAHAAPAPDSGRGIDSGSFASMPSAGSTRTAAVMPLPAEPGARGRLGPLAWMLGGAALAMAGGLAGVVAMSTAQGDSPQRPSAAVAPPTTLSDAAPPPVTSSTARVTSDGGPTPQASPRATASAIAQEDDPVERSRPAPRRPPAAPRRAKRPPPSPSDDEPLPSEFLPGEL